MRVQRQITSEFRESLPDICQSIDSINTTLTFLLTLRVTADQSLHDFMVDTLRIKDTGLHSRKVSPTAQWKNLIIGPSIIFDRASMLTVRMISVNVIFLCLTF